MDSVTTSATNTAKRFSIKRTGICLLAASVLWIPAAFNRLKQTAKKNSVAKNKNSSYRFLYIIPTKRAEYLLKFPPLDKMASPTATLQEEKTEIIVSVEALLLLLI